MLTFVIPILGDPHWVLAVLHWLNVELWSPGWANIMMPSIWTLVGILIADVRNARRTKRVKLHPDDAGDIAGQIEALSDKLVELMGGKHDDDHE